MEALENCELSSSSTLVAIHKRERKSELFEMISDSSNNGACQTTSLKKRKFKLVSNDIDDDSPPSVSVINETKTNELPHDRKELLKIVNFLVGLLSHLIYIVNFAFLVAKRIISTTKI